MLLSVTLETYLGCWLGEKKSAKSPVYQTWLGKH